MSQPGTAWRALAGTLVLIGVACGSRDQSSGLIGVGGRNTPVRINELMPRNSFAWQDDHGESDDWIELYNPDGTDVSLSGYFLSDNADSPYKARLTDAAIVPAKGFLVLTADNEPEQGDLHLGFGLNADGEGVWLTTPDGRSVDSVTFGSGASDSSYSRYPDGVDIDKGGSWAWCSIPTPDALNGESCGDTGGTNTGGANTGGTETGGAGTAGASTGGADTAGASTGGTDAAGASTGGASTGGAT